MKQIVYWERNHQNRNYSDAVIERIMPPEVFKDIALGKGILRIPDEVKEAYAEEKKIPVELLKPLQEHSIVCTSDFFGRLGIFLSMPARVPHFDSREKTLDLIERATEVKPRVRNSEPYWLPASFFAKTAHSDSIFSDGLLYMLGDDLHERLVNDMSRNSVAFCFVKDGSDLSKIGPLVREKLRFWEGMQLSRYARTPQSYL